jgi:hypothetical protein
MSLLVLHPLFRALEKQERALFLILCLILEKVVRERTKKKISEKK